MVRWNEPIDDFAARAEAIVDAAVQTYDRAAAVHAHGFAYQWRREGVERGVLGRLLHEQAEAGEAAHGALRGLHRGPGDQER